MSVKVKICGVTEPSQVREIVRLGADYIGCIVEFPKSPRSVSVERAREIREVVDSCRGEQRSPSVEVVGVIVDKPTEELKRLIEETGIRIWQLHGQEDEEYVKRVKEFGVEVWKAVGGLTECHSCEGRNPETKTNRNSFYFLSGSPIKVGDDIGRGADKIVVDAQNPLHGAGGSGQLSDWRFAKELKQQGYSVVLSGGLNPENAREAIQAVKPDIIDVSSGVEVNPGIKDMLKVEQFIHNAKSV